MTSDIKSKIDSIIRHHYFVPECEHKNYEQCCAFIIGEIMKAIDYVARDENEVLA